MSDARIPSKAGKYSSPHTLPKDSKKEDKGSGPAVSTRSRADAVPGGIKATGLIDKSPATSTSTQAPVVTSAPKLIDHSPRQGTTPPKSAPSSSSASSSALSTPPARTGPEKLDFSQPETAGMVEREAPRGDIHVLAGMIEQGAAKHVSADSRNILMTRLVHDTSLGAEKQTSLVETLLKAGADARGVHRGTPHIVAAASQGNVDLVLLLAAHGADINAKDDRGNTALMRFARFSDDAEGRLCILHLQQKKPNANVVNDDKQNALLVAAEAGNAKCLKTLMQLDSKLDQKDIKHQGLLITAVRSGSIDTVQVALEAKVKVDQRDQKGETALFHAISKKDIDMVKLLIKSGADINKANKKGETPLAFVCRGTCSEEIIMALLEAGANPNKADNKARKPIDWIQEKDRSRYEALFAKFNGKGAKATKVEHAVGVEKTKSGVDPQAPLFNAIASNNVGTVRTCIAQFGFDANKPNQDGETPLGYACKLGCSDEMIFCLLSLYADPMQTDSHGKLPISYADEQRRARYEEIFNGPSKRPAYQTLS